MEEDFRGYRRRSSIASAGTDLEYYSGSRPKVEKPWTFEGHYSELVNVLNWISVAHCYLNQCTVSENRKVGYARTYLSKL
eukprot:1872756-Rhodomonas_salina.1